ncbi:MAG TPA: NfeD family protein [Bacilli bacterium]
MSLWIVWLIAGLLLIVAEITTFTFYLLWLGIGALVGCVLALIFPDAYVVQILGASIAAIILTYFTKPFIRNRMEGSKGYTDKFELLVGKRGEVKEAVPLEGLGIVLVGNETWSAEANEFIEQGETIVVTGRNSTVLQVAKLRGD